ncbi:MAG: HAD family hydrolase [bacterium]|nr:HAD family hydrolase [bacterium]
MILLFDAANTLIHKPDLFNKVANVLNKNKLQFDFENLKKNHKFISEIVHFPDKTSKDFYRLFNTEWLYSIGIIPNNKLLDEIFEVCSYLPWEPFPDTVNLHKLKIKKAIISNFHGELNKIIDKYFPALFDVIIVSEIEKIRKPNLEFYKRAMEKLECNPEEIIYIGDSIKLDIEPALKLGMKAWLIDRDNIYPNFYRNIKSFDEITLDFLSN